MSRLFSNLFLRIFVGVVALHACANHAFFFVDLAREVGDFAVNALQIERCKHFNELYGNYSRFHFNHPGPGFFYLYALGEFIFYDLFLFVPTPHSAHTLAGLLIQAAFFTAAVRIAHDWIRSPWFVSLALVTAAVHFGLARDTFISIWPPHVLVMPFLCFLIASASTAAGRAAHLPLATLAGCFLVHGYVAQPLYVVTLFLITNWLFWRHTRQPGETWWQMVRRHRWPHVVAGGFIALFVLPIVIDLFYGQDSNFARILEFLRGHRGEHQSLWRSLLYLLSFFCYLHSQDQFLPEYGGTDTSFLGRHLLHFGIWAIVFGVVLSYLVRTYRQRENVERPFILALTLLLAVTFALSLVWGVIQVGPMFEFNGQFYYGTLFAVLVLAVAAVSKFLPARGSKAGAIVLSVMAAVIAWKMQHPPISTQDPDYGTVASTQAALAADPAPNATKLLVFDHDDWGQVAAVALDLKRAGKSYRVDGNWTFMFGRYRTFRPQPPNYDLSGMSVWRFTRNGPADSGQVIVKNLKVYFDPFPLDPASGVIDCRKGGNLNLFSVFGFTSSDGSSSWTNMPEAGLQFRSPPATQDVRMEITAEPFAPHSRNLFSQPMHLFVNGHKIASYDLRERQTVSARIPREIWNRHRVVSIVFNLPSANSPSQLRLSADPRILGWAMEKIAFEYVP